MPLSLLIITWRLFICPTFIKTYAYIIEEFILFEKEKIMNVNCRIMAVGKEESGNRKKPINRQTGIMVVVEILSDRGNNKQIVVSRSQDLVLEIGYKIKCVTGQAFVLINPGTQAGGFMISEMSSNPMMAKYPSILEITDEMTININRGKIHTTNEIGTSNTSAGSFTR
jgi:hypothetical protein